MSSSSPIRPALLVTGLALGACADSAPLGTLGLGECQFGPRGGLCTNGPCSLVVPVGAVRGVVSVELSPEDPPPGLAEETAGGLLCRVGPSDLRFERDVELRLDYSGRALPVGLELEDLSGFEILPSGAPAPVLAARPDPGFSRLVVPIDGAALAGATFVPVDVDLTAVLGRVPFDVSDAPSYLRTISSFEFDAAFFDGQRLYVGNGPRVLVWSGGLPEDPYAPPDVVLGRPDLVTVGSGVSAADFSGRVRAIWSDGRRLVVAEGNRVLIWNRIPTESHAPADLVLGQEDFDGAAPNAGGAPSAATLSAPAAIASDGQRLLVADTINHRALVWRTFPRLLGQPADFVVGQQSFTENRIRGGAISMYQPYGVYFDGTRTLFTSAFGCACALGVEGPVDSDNPSPQITVGEDSPTRVTPTSFSQPGSMSALPGGGFALFNRVANRVSLWRAFPERPDQIPDVVVGQPDLTVGGAVLAPVAASSFAAWEQASIDAANGVLLVPDAQRLLVWRSIPEHDFAPADLVIGQPGFTTAEAGIDYRNIGRETMAFPSGLAVAGARSAFADEGNSRVVLRTLEPEGGERLLVLGQADAQGFAPNRGRAAPGPDTLSGPRAVATDGERVVVADTQNHRVLVWDRWPDRDGAPADRVIGQPDFRTGAPNRGRSDEDTDGWPDASARALFYPSGVALTAGQVVVADTFNHRVLTFALGGGAEDPAASGVVGQPDFTAVGPNRGEGWFTKRGDGLAMPMGVEVDAGGRLWVADRENNRVLGFAAPWTGSADVVLGQSGPTANDTPNFPPSTASSRGFPIVEAQWEVGAGTMRRPEDVALAQGRLLVADTMNHRVLVFEPPFETGQAAARVLGQDGPEARVANTNGVSAASMSGPASIAADGDRVWVADRGNHRLLGFSRAALSPGADRAAVELRGQLDMLANGVNQSSGSPGLLARPSGVAFDGARLWVADREQHRVIGYDEDDEPALVLGQSTLSRARENAGRSPAADTLSAPTDVYADAEVVVVADRGNHRVLLWRGSPAVTGRPADVVIGQPDFQGASPNRGRGFDGAGPDSLRAPEGVFYDGQRLYVADTGNSRVLVFEEPLPPTGAVATRVLCQDDAAGNLPNRGRDLPGADTCSSPKDVTRAEGRLWIADTANNRVLGVPDGARAADVVLGQPDAASRAARPAAADTLRSPTSVDYDGQNLLVTDTGNHRVLVFETPPTETGAAAGAVIGQPTLLSGNPSPDEDVLGGPTRVAVTPRPFNSARVYVADAGRSRVAVFDGLARIDAE